jgi:hypothetical protein
MRPPGCVVTVPDGIGLLFTPVIPLRVVLTWYTTELEAVGVKTDLPLLDFEATPAAGTL